MTSQKPFYEQTIEKSLQELGSTQYGLASDEAKRRIQAYGLNRIRVKTASLWSKLFAPFKNVFMFILILAAIISLLTHESIDVAIILFIIAVTVLIYYVQRFSADRVLRALEKHDRQSIEVFRDNALVSMDAEYLVPGDVIQLHEGQKVPADARIIRAESVRCDESMLTGESMPVSKNVHVLESDKHVYERSNMVFQGSYVVSGNASALVVSTGNMTEFGQLAALSGRVGLSSPVQQKIDKLISQIVVVVTVLATIVFALSLYRGLTAPEALRLVLTFSVSAIPEGLPIAISVVLILGMRRLAKHNALVRNMAAIENIGLVTTVATDKTGTLTKNMLSVQDVWPVSGSVNLQYLARHAFLAANRNENKTHDPLDTALIAFAEKYQQAADGNEQLIKSLPFDHRFASSGNVWQNASGYSVYLKGAPEKVFANCSLTRTEHKEALRQLHSLTGKGYRVIALAKSEQVNKVPQELEDLQKEPMELVGLVAIADELRPESKMSVIATQQAGVTVRMITGDHFETAFAIAKKIGLAKHRDQVFDCSEMDKVTDDQLKQLIADVRVFSRVLPEHKHRILGILKANNVTAMTGDGVNDVPALTNAHIGIAMGGGSQIAKEAGDIVLLDDNFKTITSAIREGRVIFDNIRRMLFYLLSTNMGEVLTTVVALMLGMPIPLLPVQILWTNLGTDTAMVIPLGLEPAEQDVMSRPPRQPQRPILGKIIIARMLLVSLTMMVIALTTFHYFLQYKTESYARTMVFSALVVMQLTNAVNARSEWQSVFSRLFVYNRAIWAGLAAALTLYFIAVFGPMQQALHLQAPEIGDVARVWFVSIIAITTVNEAYKFVSRKFFDIRQ